jgi:hypothetical protein
MTNDRERSGRGAAAGGVNGRSGTRGGIRNVGAGARTASDCDGGAAGSTGTLGDDST